MLPKFRGSLNVYTIWYRQSKKGSWRIVTCDTDEKRIRVRYEELKATVKRGEIKLALDMAVVHRDTLQAVRA